MYMMHDPDEYEMVSHSKVCSTCNGDLRKCNGACNGIAGYSMVKRKPEEVAKIKAEKIRKREDEILAQADAIRARRS